MKTSTASVAVTLAANFLAASSANARPVVVEETQSFDPPQAGWTFLGESVAIDGDSALARLTVDECLSYTLTCDPDVALLGLSFPNEQDAAFAAAERFRPLAPPELASLRERAVVAMQGKGAAWWNPPV